jgi:GT2 family glycosyltransferase
MPDPPRLTRSPCHGYGGGGMGNAQQGEAGQQAHGLGVVIVAFRSADVIADCIDSLFEADAPPERVVLCDNDSPDESAAIARARAEAHGLSSAEAAPGDAPPPARLVILRIGANRGYAGGANPGLAMLAADPAIDLFWVLNPDCRVDPRAPTLFRAAAARSPAFSLMGGRIRYIEPPCAIQSDGGRVSRWTGICRNVNQGLLPQQAQPPDPASLDFILGASMIASRAFLAQAGPMREDYFLYYEEVDWAARRGALPLLLVPEAVVHHHGGTVIGSGSPTRGATPFALWFNNRNRMRFMRRFHPLALPLAWANSLARTAKLLLTGDRAGAGAAIRGLLGLAPPAPVAKGLPAHALD